MPLVVIGEPETEINPPVNDCATDVTVPLPPPQVDPVVEITPALETCRHSVEPGRDGSVKLYDVPIESGARTATYSVPLADNSRNRKFPVSPVDVP